MVARSRRGFLRAAGISAVTAAPVLLGGCGDDGGAPPAAAGPADVDILNTLLDYEQQCRAAYEAGRSLLRGPARAVGERFLAQELEQADLLADEIKRLGGKPKPFEGGHDFPTLRTQTDALGLADSIETSTIATYVASLPKITDDRLRGTAAAMMTTAAEHTLVLREQLGSGAGPLTFVLGEQVAH